MNKCPTCTHTAESPYRRYVDGKIVEGCVDVFHTGAIPKSDQDSIKWHEAGVDNFCKSFIKSLINVSKKKYSYSDYERVKLACHTKGIYGYEGYIAQIMRV